MTVKIILGISRVEQLPNHNNNKIEKQPAKENRHVKSTFGYPYYVLGNASPNLFVHQLDQEAKKA